MNQIDDKEIIELRGEVFELMGRCILNLQNYELGMKQFLSTSEFRVNSRGSDLPQRRARYAEKTLGQLIKAFTGNHVTAISQKSTSDEMVDNRVPSGVEIEVRAGIEMDETEHALLIENLRELVALRNQLVHHFLSDYPLSDQENCLSAKKHLSSSLELIKHHTDQLKGFFKSRTSAGQALSKFISSGDFSHYITYGFIPGEPINWPQTRVVEHLKAAELELQTKGWTELLIAIDWIKTKAPYLSPKSHGCPSWRALLHTSSLFEIRKEQLEDGTSKTLYRSL
jgi:hypothetical protein